jgi:hypothetical protein
MISAFGDKYAPTHTDEWYEYGHYVVNEKEWPYRFILDQKAYFAHHRKNEHWFIKAPKQYILDQYGIDIDWKTSEALGNLFERDWIDFCYVLSAFGNKEDGIKLFIGPIAAMAKETGVRALDVVSDKQKLIRLVNDTLTFNQKKAMLPELSEDYDIVRTRHVFAEISDNEIGAALESCIIDNQTQWEKAKAQPNMLNWFVGQIMKKYGGKIDASRVRTILDKFL